jgi:ATP-dependent Lon protease
MAEARSVPVLFVSDLIVLPTMVVPIELDDAARAAVDAARASESGKLLIAPRLEDRYPSYGVLASIVQVGRIAGGNGTAAVVRGEQRAHIGAGTTGPGAALWVEVTEVTEPEQTDETRALAAEYKKLLLAMLQRREAWQIIDFVNKLTIRRDWPTRPVTRLTDVQKRQLLETPDVAERLRADPWTGDHLAEVEVTDKIAERARRHGETRRSSCCVSNWPPSVGTRRGRADGSTTIGPHPGPPTCPKVREAARVRSASWNARASRAPRAAGSAPGWTPSSTCRGTSPPRTPPT